MILLIDNYDSFTYNLYQYIGEIEPCIKVIKNNSHSLAEIKKLKPAQIILSPGPGRPENSGVCLEVIRELGSSIPILGVCLGHQAIGFAHGADITYAQKLMHGKTSNIQLLETSKLFRDLPQNFKAARYHSLIVDKKTVPATLKITAQSEQGEIMALEHREYPIYGLQFHPESILSPQGKTIIRNFIFQERT